MNKKLPMSSYRPLNMNNDTRLLHRAWLKLQSEYVRYKNRNRGALQRKKGRSWSRRVKEAVSLRNTLRLMWVVLIWWGERRVFESAIRNCGWENWEEWPTGATPHRMALIADPQIIDPHTYSRRGLSLTATIYYTDQYMRRSYSTIQELLLPSTTLFLGDLFDGGREWAHTPPSLYAQKKHIHTSDGPVPVRPDPDAEADWKLYKDDYWWGEYLRFAKIFPAYPYRRTVKTLPGNHDLGIGNGIREPVKDRFRTWFGETSSIVEAGNHSIVLLDSVSLSNDVNPRIYGPEFDFLNSLPLRLSTPEVSTTRYPHSVQQSSSPPHTPTSPSEDTIKNHLPTILLTHVPLYRAPNTPCGPLRESRSAIAIRGGYQYQNVLTPELSNEILQKTNAKYVYSGDDHDYCEVEHMYTGDQGKVKEITVKSFAWTMGIRRPGFLLVSLWNPKNEPLDPAEEMATVQSKLCLLPDQIGTFIAYVQMFMFTALIIIITILIKRIRGIPDEEPLLPTTNSREKGSVGMSSSSAPVGPSSRGGNRASTPRVWDRDENKYLKATMKKSRSGYIGGMKEFRDEVVAVAWVVLGIYVFLLLRW